MSRIYVPTTSIEDWKRLLAKPELHWKAGYSAMTLAAAWEDAPPGQLPPEIDAALATSGRKGWGKLKLLAALPEYKVPLPGGSRASQTDLLVLARGPEGLITIAVEGKVDEQLGPTVGQKRGEQSAGVNERLAFLLHRLGLAGCPDDVRYQLLHRTVSALQAADDFDAESAVMLVHSFSPTSKWLDDFKRFAVVFGHEAEPGRLLALGERGSRKLFIGWVVGDPRFRS